MTVDKHESLWGNPIYSKAVGKEMKDIRKIGATPLAWIHKTIASRYIGDSPVLFLGSGIGQEMQLSGLPQDHMTGVDISLDYTARARQFLPQSTFYTGDVAIVFQQKDFHFPVMVAWNFLDCISPAQLLTMLSAIRERTDRLVIAQDLVAHHEFYASPSMQGTPVATPGYTSWTNTQRALVDNVCGNNQFSTISEALRAGQRLFEDQHGVEVQDDIVDVIRSTGMNFSTAEKYFSQIKSLPGHEQMLITIGNLTDNILFQIQTYNSPFSQLHPKYAQLHRAKTLLEQAKWTIQTLFFRTIVSAALDEAGFQNITPSTLCAVQEDDESAHEVGVGEIQTLYNEGVGTRYRVGDELLALRMEGISITAPFSKPVSAASVRVIIAG
ncbi:MAG: hypothetical protein NUV65_00420 [Candidatus Roizmanbacteria bacterium]|nr:hypothetical protein [Candidatus Roizmanbacteria bacterium]